MNNNNNDCRIFLWNCRGAGSPDFFRFCKQYLDGSHPDICVIMELRVDASRLKRTFNMLGFDEFHFSNTRGFSGGIVVAWRSDRVQGTVLTIHFQFIHLQITDLNNMQWYFSAVYANPNEELKRNLWDHLYQIASSIQGGWLVAGDLNDVLSRNECIGSDSFNTRKATNFARRLDSCNLMDLGAIGSKYTWRGRIVNGVRSFRRLDRGVCNEAWRVMFPDAVVRVLPRLDFSDHHPILIQPAGLLSNYRVKPFRFERVWLTHPSYNETISTYWETNLDITQNINNMEVALRSWSKDIFGDIRKRKSRILNRIGGVQRQVVVGRGNRFLIRLEKSLQDELSTLLFQEEMIWHQKSRSKWLSDGDRNTRYYHVKTINRRRRNRITSLRNDAGHWIEEEAMVRNMINQFYYNLFHEECVFGPWIDTSFTYGTLAEENIIVLQSDISVKEVKNALFSMGEWKAPGPDSFPPGFYRKAWPIVGNTVVDFVRKVWSNPNDIQCVNKTDICLIPKVDKPEFVTQFRPISLCNTIYKVVTKVVVNRLKEVIDDIVSPYQTGFIPGRIIHENIVVAQELVHTMRRMTGRKGGLAIKVDLAKAYDRLKWSYIFLVLKNVGLPDNLIDLIMACITTVQTNVLWNGNRNTFFRPQRGIRQGDPLSPYIFVLCMDKLSHIISEEVEKGNWKAIQAGRNGPHVSHLMFADDLLLFGQATMTQIDCMCSSLKTFCDMSGQKVSVEKTSILFSKGVPTSVKRGIVSRSGYREVYSLGKYLGIPLIGRMPKRSDYDYLVDMVKNKLAGWKANQLSFAGRITLSKAVIEALPLYPMMTSVIPKSCLQEIQQLQRKFIWGDTTENRRYHAVGWSSITTPKKFGGLGIRNLITFNTACFMKLGWSFRHGEDKLWCQVLRGKYARDGSSDNGLVVKPSDSSIWKQMASVWSQINELSFWTIGNGVNISVWGDAWIMPGLKLSSVVDHIPPELSSLKVCDLVGVDGDWNLQNLASFISPDLLSRIRALLPPRYDYGDDLVLWPGNSIGEFSVASSYNLLSNFPNSEPSSLWPHVWKLRTPERVRSFIWLLVHDRLLTNSRKSVMGLGNANCTHCGSVPETALHVLRDCPRAVTMWLGLVKVEMRNNFFGGDLFHWLQLNLMQANWKRDGVDWAAWWATASHLLWGWKNKEEHEVTFTRPRRPWSVVSACVQNYQVAMAMSRLSQHHDVETVEVKWDPPTSDWICLNCDGAVNASNKVAGCGGLMRNSDGLWLSGFSKQIGYCEPLVAELWGVFTGLQLCRSRGWGKVIVQIDSKVVCDAIIGSEIGRILGWSIVREIRKLLKLPWEVRVVNIFREANRCADELAKIGCHQGEDLIIYEQCPVSVGPLLLADTVGNSIPRLVSC